MTQTDAKTMLNEKHTDQELQELRDAFEVLDRNRDGHISLSELQNFVSAFWTNANDVQIKSVFMNADLDGNGFIEFEEFAKLVGKTFRQRTTIRDYTKAFKAFDLDGDGYITTSELTKVLSSVGDQSFTQAEALELVREADIDGDGRLNYQEFVQYLLKPGGAMPL